MRVFTSLFRCANRCRGFPFLSLLAYFYFLKKDKKINWPVTPSCCLANSMKHIGLLAIPRQTWEEEHSGTCARFRVGRAGLIVNPVQGDLTTINCTNQLTEKWREIKAAKQNKKSLHFKVILNISLNIYILKCLILLAIRDGGSGFQECTDQSLQPSSPAPGSGTEALRYHRTVLLEECTKSFTAYQGGGLKEKQTKWTQYTEKVLKLKPC